MSGTGRAAQWMYRGLWSVLVDWFQVPANPPTLPVRPGALIHSFQPDEAFLRYLKLYFWLVLLGVDIPITAAWVALLYWEWWLGLLLAPLAWFLIIAPDIVAYIAIHLRYDSTWYVMTDRSLRIRHGIWIIREVTITFENVQNIYVQQGPVQRHFGISDLIVQTAGGGASRAHAELGHDHQGVIEGISTTLAAELRDRIRHKLRSSPAAGLGDDDLAAEGGEAGGRRWTAAQVAMLRAIRDEAALAARRMADL